MFKLQMMFVQELPKDDSVPAIFHFLCDLIGLVFGYCNGVCELWSVWGTLAILRSSRLIVRYMPIFVRYNG